MKIFFDNCTSPVLARTLNGFLENRVGSAHHARDLGLHKAKDVEWMDYLAKTGDHWLVITGDGRIGKNKLEQLAFRKAKLRGIVLARAYQKTQVCRQAGLIVANWDDLTKTINRLEPPFLFEMSINLNARFKQLSF